MKDALERRLEGDRSRIWKGPPDRHPRTGRHGNVVIRDRGLLRPTFQVDTLGDSDLENDVFVEGSFELLRDAGAHPGFYLDFCEIATDVIG